MTKILRNSDFFDSSFFPIRLYYAFSSNNLGLHLHEFTEWAVVLKGKAKYITDFGEEIISSGDVLIIPPGGRHGYAEEEDIELMNILFQFNKLPIPRLVICRYASYGALFKNSLEYYHKHKFYPKVHLPEKVLARIEKLLVYAYLEQQKKKKGAPLSVLGSFLQFIPILLEYYEPGEEQRKDEMISHKMKTCIDFMFIHFRDSLTVEGLAHRAGLSPITFSRQFKSITGRTPLNYILNLRLEEAERLLRTGVYTIGETAFATGFSDSNYFSRLYRKYMGCSPHQTKLKGNLLGDS